MLFAYMLSLALAIYNWPCMLAAAGRHDDRKITATHITHCHITFASPNHALFPHDAYKYERCCDVSRRACNKRRRGGGWRSVVIGRLPAYGRQQRRDGISPRPRPAARPMLNAVALVTLPSFRPRLFNRCFMQSVFSRHSDRTRQRRWG